MHGDGYKRLLKSSVQLESHKRRVYQQPKQHTTVEEVVGQSVEVALWVKRVIKPPARGMARWREGS